MSHTSGPWAIRSRIDAHSTAIDIGNGTTYVCTAHGGNPHEALANARLISAAPELLAVVANIVKYAESNLRAGFGPTDVSGFPLGLSTDARAALAKATGV